MRSHDKKYRQNRYEVRSLPHVSVLNLSIKLNLF